MKKSPFVALFALAAALFSIYSYGSTEAGVSTSQEPEKDSYSRQYGINVSLQLPTGPFVELNYRPTPRFTFGLGAGGWSTSNYVDNNNSLNLTAVEARARWHVSDRAFFFGIAAGYQVISYDTNEGYIMAYEQTTTSLSRFYLTPHIGWMWILDSGVTLGMELGVQVPVSTSELSMSSSRRNLASAQREIEPWRTMVLPYINFFKLGYSF